MRLRFIFNAYLTQYYYYHRKIELKNAPRVFAIELTNYCNLDCLMCPRRAMTRKIGFMDFNLFKKIVDQVKGYNEVISLVNFGDPLFHPQLEEFINYSAKNGIRPIISTNATILDEEKARMLLDSKLYKIILSLDANSRVVYQKVRQGANFDNTLNNIVNFLNLKKSLNKTMPLTELGLIRMEETEGEIIDFKKEWKDLADIVEVKPFLTWARQIDSVTAMANPRQLAYPFRDKRYPCMSLWRYGVVLWNGDFVPCCMDFNGKMVLGNLNKERLESIWNSTEMKRIRKAHVDGNYNNSICRNCIEWIGDARDASFPLSSNMFRIIARYFRNRV